MCPELVPFWCLPDHDKMIKIERIVPMYPLSKDQAKYEHLIFKQRAGQRVLELVGVAGQS
ncbi:hypothetical protein Pmgp_02929 [Pelotomaculum propionicicum]|uniref:Uncharacterized protein n=2 Tax=Pelotomaculum propionicicum TaxID=258475 RepID=A0A4Y7RLE9_9FIRM|nr:hypothetical protein Pmgp_02929 [Pelotomaculum propionicicum]